MTDRLPAVFPIVGIGASAGGIEALEGFFSGLPTRPGLGFVIVTHLSPERESLLHEIIRRYTELQVHIAADGVLVEVDSVYVLPADAILNIAQRRLLIRKPESNRRERKPIDIFFSALATDLGELAAGVVLSGGDGDGTLGIKAIKERGGLTLAQVHNGHGPTYPDMPNSAISTGFVDFAAPASEMGGKLVQFAHSLEMLDGIAEQSRITADGETLDEAAKEIYAILRTQTGHEFSGYKSKTFLRRVHRRMDIRQLSTLEAYAELLRQEPPEVSVLFRDLLINVTNFFRDADAFENLAHLVIPKLFDGCGADDTVRVWVPGCATGEEVFSIGMLMREHMDQLAVIPRVQIFATDIDERAIAVARHYPGQRFCGPAQAILHPRRRQLRRFQRSPQSLHLLPPQRHPRPTLFAHRPCVLSQPADLFRAGGARPGHPNVSLRAPTGWLSLSGHVGEHHALRRAVRASREKAPHLSPPAGDRAERAAAACHKRLPAGVHERARAPQSAAQRHCAAAGRGGPGHSSPLPTWS